MNRRMQKKEWKRRVDAHLDSLEFREVNVRADQMVLLERMSNLEEELSAVKDGMGNLAGDFLEYKAKQREKERVEWHREARRLAAEKRRRERKRDLARRVAVFLLAFVTGIALILLLMEPEAEEQEQPAVETTQTVLKAAVPGISPAEAVIQAAKTLEEESGEPESRYAPITDRERELLARLIWLEARGESAEGQQAVAEVVLNRVAADNFPETVATVIFESGQFSTAGRLPEASPGEAQYEAIDRALGGENILPLDVVYFSGRGENDRVWGKIGGHVFCYQYIWG